MAIFRDCTITWYARRRPTDISGNIATSTYVAAVMVEDFFNQTTSTPFSSVPLQMYEIIICLVPMRQLLFVEG